MNHFSTTSRKDLERIFKAGLSAVDPGAAILRHCRVAGDYFYAGGKAYRLSDYDRLLVVGAGKAAAPMAKTLESLLGSRIKDGHVVVKDGYGGPLDRIGISEAGHPVPDARGKVGAETIMEKAETAGEKDLVICVISGGGSALLPLPEPGFALEDKQQTVRTLLACGASIHEINTIRKHISGIKGGRLAEAIHPATVITLILSDVVGDDLDVIASGPTVPDSSTYGDCVAICRAYGIDRRLPERVMAHLYAGSSGKVPETPKLGHPAFKRTQHLIVGNNRQAVLAAKEKAEEAGYHTLVLSTLIEGETRHVARVHTAIAKEILRTGHPIPPPACILSGGETTVNVTGTGLGGRNQEFALAAAMDIADEEWVTLLSGGTDGTDGPTDAAGAFCDTRTIERAAALGMKPGEYLSNNDAYHFFETLGDLLITGPTRTNVMDLRIMIVVQA